MSVYSALITFLRSTIFVRDALAATSLLANTAVLKMTHSAFIVFCRVWIFTFFATIGALKSSIFVFRSFHANLAASGVMPFKVLLRVLMLNLIEVFVVLDASRLAFSVSFMAAIFTFFISLSC